MKKSKRAEVNFLPDHPEGQTDESLENERVAIAEETRKKRIDATLIPRKMEASFSLRRKEVVEVEPLVEEIRERWSALFYEEEICREFFRITNINLLSTFIGSLDKYTAPLLKLYRRCREAFGQEVKILLENLDEQETDAEDHYTKDVQIGILSVMKDNVAAATSLPKVTNIAIILKEAVVLRDIVDLPTAFAYLFGLLYAINMEYPQELKYTFEAIQKIFRDLGGSCSARVQSLKIKLC
ncbi:uncharacterized protein LOC108411621 [Pygocentrus nattereri]|uniref:uncharacterized protein LOC108411621 n=1 Tax=Pygocentrus nattereri TaxID=42514 RepID=UPI0008145073|nr:uncharacterized protein LOC108411621 [Pygocentrus nattereri]